MKKIFAKFKSKCADTGKPIQRGEQMYYDYSTRKCYKLDSPKGLQQSGNASDQQEARNISSYVQAQEDAYYDNQYQATL
jgi:hypothetical protein